MEIKMAKNELAWKFTELEILRELNDSRKEIIKDKQHIEVLEVNIHKERERIKDFEKRLAKLKKK